MDSPGFVQAQLSYAAEIAQYHAGLNLHSACPDFSSRYVGR